MAKRGNIYSSLYQSDSDVEDQKTDDNPAEASIPGNNTETDNDLEIARLLAIDFEHEVAKPRERISNIRWRTEMIYQALEWLGRDTIEIIAAYAAHTEIERLICVLEDVSRRGFNNILIDVGFKYFETNLKLEWFGGPELPYDCKQYRFSVKCASSMRELHIDGALEDVLPFKKHLFGLTWCARNKKENRKLRTAYRLKMVELFMRY